MKKFIASVMVVCISATFLFVRTSAATRTPAIPAIDEYAFFDVDGVELTDAEKNDVEGEGAVGAIVGVASGIGIGESVGNFICNVTDKVMSKVYKEKAIKVTEKQRENVKLGMSVLCGVAGGVSPTL